MIYFLGIGITLGFLMVISAGLLFLYPKPWADFFLSKVYPEKRPFGVDIVAIVALIVLSTTWYLLLKFPNSYGFVITIVVTLSAVKMCLWVFQYERFRLLTTALLRGDALALRIMAGCSLAIGGGLLILSAVQVF
ncbi:MAG: hypothetical protein Q8R76_01430 [Candidatus Omnitrophota bacterium]|nr:hypothetical protein [Candidatus Omnitrophota bacterium]